MTKNPHVEVLAVHNNEFMRYDGTVKIVKDDALLEKVRIALPQIMSLYDKNGWEMGHLNHVLSGKRTNPFQ